MLSPEPVPACRSWEIQNLGMLKGGPSMWVAWTSDMVVLRPV